MNPGREGLLESWVEKGDGVPGESLSFPLLSGHFNYRSSRPPRPQANHVLGLSSLPGANPDVRPECRQPVAIAYVRCHSFPLPLIPSRHLVAGSAPILLRFHWFPLIRGHFIAICVERCQSPNTCPRLSTIGLEVKAGKGLWLT